MRALLLALVVVLAFVVVRWFRPADASAATTEEPTADSAHFLTPNPPSSQVEPAAAEPGPGASAQDPMSSESTTDVWPATLPPGEPAGDAEVRVAAALLHGAPADVQAATEGFPRDRAVLLEAFSWAMLGERDMAIDLSRKLGKEALDGREKALFEAALTGRSSMPASAAAGAVPLAMEMALLAREAKQAMEAREFPDSARAYSSLLIGELGAPWPADRRALAEWSGALDSAQREHRWSPRGDWPATEVEVQSGDSLIAIRLRYVQDHPGALMCTGLIERANRLKGHIQPKQRLKIPTERVSVVVDLGARWALYRFGDEVAAAWPVAIGRAGEETPTGEFTVRNKIENPPWMKEGQEPIPFGDPRNPLGTRWIGWSQAGAKTSYGLHGTWEPDTIGQAASDGCIRLANQDVEALFQILPEGAPILVRD